MEDESEILLAETADPCRTDRQPWLRLPEEQPRHYEWFHHWLLMGPKRTLVGAFTYFARLEWRARHPDLEFVPPRTISGAWKRIAQENGWKERAEAFDAAYRERNAQDFEEHRREYQEASWRFIRELHDRARQMLSHPLTEEEITRTTEDEDGRTVIQQVVVKPARWAASDVPALLKAADQLARTATAIEVARLLRDLERLDGDELVSQAKIVVEEARRAAIESQPRALPEGDAGGEAGDALRSEDPDEGEAAGNV